MKRQRKSKKIKAPTQGMINVAVIVIFIFLAFLLTRAFLYRSDYFRLRIVEIRDSFLDQKTASAISNQLLNLNKGKNIFRIGLKNIARTLWATYPDAKEITAKIMLPDKLCVTMKFRKPVAIVRNIRSYPIDEDGVVLSSVNPALLSGLPLIEGVNMRYDSRRDRRGGSDNLMLALELLREIKRSKFIAEYGISAIDAGDPKNLSFRLASGPEIRIGSEDFANRLDALEKTLKEPRLVLDRINYIDLRFKDVVIGPK